MSQYRFAKLNVAFLQRPNEVLYCFKKFSYIPGNKKYRICQGPKDIYFTLMSTSYNLQHSYPTTEFLKSFIFWDMCQVPALVNSFSSNFLMLLSSFFRTHKNYVWRSSLLGKLTATRN